MSVSAAEEALARAAVVRIAKRTQELGYVVATDGNCSMRLGDGSFVITPSGVRKEALREELLVRCGPDGEPVAPPTHPGAPRPSSERRLHAAVYEVRPDVRFVCHAHPKTVVAMTLCGQEIAACLLPEVLIGVGPIAQTKYATPTTRANADAVRVAVRDADAVVLDRHGSVTVGATPDAAFDLLERLEWAAVVTRDARLLAGGDPLVALPPGEVERLLEVRRALTGSAKVEPCNLCGACVADPAAP